MCKFSKDDKVNKQLGFLLLIQFLLVASSNAQYMFWPQASLLLGASEVEIGVMETMASLAMFLFASPASYLLFKYGMKSSLRSGLAWEMVNRCMMGLCGYLADDTYVGFFAVAYFLEGCSSCICQTAIIGLTLRTCSEESRGLMMSLLVMLLALGIQGGSFLGAFGYDWLGFGMGFYVSAFSTFLALVATYMIEAEYENLNEDLWHPSITSAPKDTLMTDGSTVKKYLPNRRIQSVDGNTDSKDSSKSLSSVGEDWLETLRIPTVFVTAMMRFNMEVYFEWEILLIPQHFDERYGYDSAQIAAVTSGIFITIGVFSPVSGIIGNKIGNLTVLVLGLFILTIGTTGLGPTYFWDDLFPEWADIYIECIGTVLVGIGLAMAHAPIGAFLANSVQREMGSAREEVVAGIMSLFMALGACCGPLVAAALMNAYGYQMTAFIHACEVFAVFVLVVILWITGVVKNDLEYIRSRRKEREVTDEKFYRPSSLVPWGGPIFNYVFADVAAYKEKEAPKFFSLHIPSAIKAPKARRTLP